MFVYLENLVGIWRVEGFRGGVTASLSFTYQYYSTCF